MSSIPLFRALLCVGALSLIHCGPDVLDNDDDPTEEPNGTHGAPTATPTATAPGGTPTATSPGLTPTPTDAPPLQGDGPLAISPGSLTFSAVPLGCTRERALIVKNEGDALVTIRDIVPSSGLGPDFSVPISAAAIDPGDSVSLSILFTPLESQSPEGTLVLLSDTDPLSYSIPVVASTSVPVETVERFDQLSPQVDILFMLDNSGSMLERQEASAAALESSLQALLAAGVDYQVGLITFLAKDQGKLQGSFGGSEQAFITSEMGASGINEFIAYILRLVRGTGASGDERGFDSLQLATNPDNRNGDNAGFFRDGVPLSIIGMTDEDDHSIVDPEPLSDHLDTELGISNIHTSFMVSQDWSYEYCGVEVSSRWIEFAGLLGDDVHDVCDQDEYSDIYDSAFADVGAALERVFVLSGEVLFPENLSVIITLPMGGGELSPTGWSFNAGLNAIVFEQGSAPPAGSQVMVSYVSEAECDN